MSANGDQISGRRLSRRRFIQAGTAVGIGVVASGYLKPSIKSLSVPKAFASASPMPSSCHGLTPGFWKNWVNHYTTPQFAAICAGTIAPTPTEVNNVFDSYNESLGYELTMLRCFILANQLTLYITQNPGMPNPSGGFLTGDCQLNGNTLAGCLNDAIAFLGTYPPGAPGVSAGDRPYAIQLKSCLDAFANM